MKEKENIKTIYLAGGCFWGVQAYMDKVLGVKETNVGYANGHVQSPTYEEVCGGKTGYAETVKVDYDSTEITLSELLSEFFFIIDPTSYNKQGEDSGEQYRTGIYFVEKEDEAIAEDKIKVSQSNYDKPILVEVEKLKNYYVAEEYHQKYLQKNPGGYCHIDLSKRFKA